MSLSAQATERIFARLTGTYGRDFSSRYEGNDANTVRSIWASELDGFEHDLQSIAWALEHLPERAPNAIEFRNLCRRAPQPEPPQLEAPRADPRRIAAELAKLGPILKKKKERNRREWAERIVARWRAGEHIDRAPLAMAREALRMDDWT